LVLSLLAIMEKCQVLNILHNNLSPSNVMLPDKPKNVCIRVCDWGMASCVVEKKSSLYGYAIKPKMEANIVEQKYVAPNLFYVFGSQG
jgi:serine/threonine protein kinase